MKAVILAVGLGARLSEETATRLLFAGNLSCQPYMIGANYLISGDLTNTDKVINNTFWIEVQPALTRAMLEFAAAIIENYLGVNFYQKKVSSVPQKIATRHQFNINLKK